MINDMFVFDCVIHLYDLTHQNTRTDRPDAKVSRAQMLSSGMALTPPQRAGFEFEKRWGVEDMHDLVFVQSPTDMAMAQAVPIFDWYKDGFAPVEAQYAMAKAYPDRVLFCGGVDPKYKGLNYAFEQLEYQVKELGARSIKFYNGHIKGAWRCDDEDVAYPLFERCQKLGIDVIQFHKGVPFGLQNVEQLSPTDLQGPARDFPEMEFIIHHLAVPYFDEAVSIASRFPNVHLALSGTLSAALFAPRIVQKQIGELLQVVGSDKLLWGSEAALIGTPAPYLKAFMDLEIPEDLRSGYGYPQITMQDKEKILGLNFAKLMRIDLEEKRRTLGLHSSTIRGEAA
ncbi:hypothetical protein B0G76_5003 [Paraburkholderia sp. BL23I1N1]|uniref:amidohydrolase family protein n=1 Tax=Paraburkholderia sp. BL23I1N1 TaxID=1938802 RepID=UPI000E73ACA4|nr:amidohydrolase family protein [Paraburkholderia sp. BL23I1N1]RKE38664.1 hypothetical protein B0G76_5003 [Paraburkholderia sp. BL23I1N1]